MAYEFKLVRRVEFREVDMGGIVHFPRFYEYMEQTEHTFLRSLGFSIHHPLDRGHTGWPRVHASCDFKAPLTYEDEMEVHLLVKEKKEKALHYLHRISKLTPNGPVEVARGTIICVCCRIAPGEPLKAIPIPEPISAAVQAAPASLLASFG
jgi:YbgC/YbaW family acyl-CoA thioester hydrolase